MLQSRWLVFLKCSTEGNNLDLKMILKCLLIEINADIAISLLSINYHDLQNATSIIICSNLKSKIILWIYWTNYLEAPTKFDTFLGINIFELKINLAICSAVASQVIRLLKSRNYHKLQKSMLEMMKRNLVNNKRKMIVQKYSVDSMMRWNGNNYNR